MARREAAHQLDRAAATLAPALDPHPGREAGAVHSEGYQRAEGASSGLPPTLFGPNGMARVVVQTWIVGALLPFDPAALLVGCPGCRRWAMRLLVVAGGPRTSLTVPENGPDGKPIGSYDVPLTHAEQRGWRTARGEGIMRVVPAGITDDPRWQAAAPAEREKYLRARLTEANDYATRMVQQQIGVDELLRRRDAAKGKKAG